jgi:hypothetical protein
VWDEISSRAPERELLSELHTWNRPLLVHNSGTSSYKVFCFFESHELILRSAALTEVEGPWLVLEQIARGNKCHVSCTFIAHC